MRTYDKIVFASNNDIQERDKAIVQLFLSLQEKDKDHPVVQKYNQFVAKTKDIYGLQLNDTNRRYCQSCSKLYSYVYS